MKVLIVDDSVAMIKAASLLVTKAGHEVITAENGYRALQVIEHEAPDLALMDVEMPVLDGFKTCMLIRGRLPKNKLPIVFLTSHGTVFDQARGRMVGGQDFIVKPFNGSRIKEILEQWGAQ